MVYCLNPCCLNPLNPENYKFCQTCGAKLIPLLRNRYHIIKPIGGSGFSRTYLAENTDRMNASCVVKQFSPSPQIQANLGSLQKATELFNQEAVGVNYRRLRELLVAGEWKQADRETLAILLKVCGREKEGWLREKDLAKFPCEDLHTIDQLWVRYSNGHFGFSIQKRTFYESGKNYQILSDRVGWRSGEVWLSYDGFTFALNAPPGHLPSAASPKVCVVFGASGGLSLFSRLDSCQQLAT